MNLQALSDAIASLLRTAGSMVLSASSSHAHTKAGHFNFVTETDVAVQEHLRQGLMTLLPDARFFSEEQENDPLANDWTWVVDPIDGTFNFMRGRHASAIAVALLKDCVPVIGMIYQPYTDELFSAIRGGGAMCNGTPIHVSNAPFEQALVLIGTAPYYSEWLSSTVYCIHQFMARCGDIRRVGSAALDCCDIAAGRAECFVELQLSPWDFAAGALLITEAGGCFEMPYRDALDFSKPACILASNPTCVDAAREITLQAKDLHS